MEQIHQKVTKSMRQWGARYPYAGYGARFRGWLFGVMPFPYNSFGNGSAMRVSAVGWMYDSLERTREVARATAEVFHNHPEGIKGAEVMASVIYLARKGCEKEEIKQYVQTEFGYDLGRTCDEIRPTYYPNATCQRTVPEAIIAFMEGEDFEDVVRNAVSLGGDCDTLAAIAGSIAEAYYGVPEWLRVECRDRLRGDLLKVLVTFDKYMLSKGADEYDMGKQNQF